MSARDDFSHITTNAAVRTYLSSTPIFEGILSEIRELSKKKPEATMSSGKVKIVNRVLDDLLTVLKDQPSGKYLEALDDESLPQVSDAVLTMVQFETAILAFKNRYYKRVGSALSGRFYWITEERIADWDKEDGEDEEEDEDGEESHDDDDDDDQ